MALYFSPLSIPLPYFKRLIFSGTSQKHIHSPIQSMFIKYYLEGTLYLQETIVSNKIKYFLFWRLIVNIYAGEERRNM